MNEITLSTKYISEINLKTGRNSLFFLNNELLVFDKECKYSKILVEDGYEVVNYEKKKRSKKFASCLFDKYIYCNYFDRKYIITHGGENEKGIIDTLELYKYNKEEKTLERLLKCTCFENLSQHVCCRIGDKYIVFYGGINDNEDINEELYFLNIDELIDLTKKKKKHIKIEDAIEEFTLGRPYIPHPYPRINCTLTYHKQTNTCILYGGKFYQENEEEEYDDDEDDGGIILNDIWILCLDDDDDDEDTYSWYAPNIISGHIPFRANHSCISIENDVYIIFGGIDDNKDIKSDIFIMETVFKMNGSDESKYKFEFHFSTPLIDASPIPLKDSSVCYDKNNHNIFFFFVLLFFFNTI